MTPSTSWASPRAAAARAKQTTGDVARGGAAHLVPGSLLNRLNPLRSLDEEGRKEFVQRYRELQEHLDNPADRLAVMDAQGVECVVNYAALPGIEVEFEDDYDGLYANLIALNRYLGTEWGFNYEDRLFTPPFISFADPEGALQLLEEILKIETPRVIQTSNGTSMHTSPFRPGERPVLVDLQRGGDQARDAPRVGHPLRRPGRGVERARGRCSVT